MSAAPSGAPVVIQVVRTSEPRQYDNYNHTLAKRLGVTQVVLALIAIVIGIVAIVDDMQINTGCNAIWSGSFWLITAAFAIASAQRKSVCTILTTMVLSIICAMGVPGLFGSGAGLFSSGIEHEYETSAEYYEEECGCRDVAFDNTTEIMCIDCVPYEDTCTVKAVNVTLGSLLMVLAVIELGISITASVTCCLAVGCCGRNGSQISNSAPVMVENGVGQQHAVTLPAGYQLAQPPQYVEKPPLYA